MMEAARTSETLVNFYQTTRRYNPEDSRLRTHRRENLKSYVGQFLRDYTAQHPRRHSSSYSPSWEPEISTKLDPDYCHKNRLNKTNSTESRVLFEKLTVAYLVKKFATFHEAPMSNTCSQGPASDPYSESPEFSLLPDVLFSQDPS
jgi:hypothetical protein